MRNQSLEAIVNELEAVGADWSKRQTGGGHINVKFTLNREGKTLEGSAVCAATESDWRAAKNQRALIRRWLRHHGVTPGQTPKYDEPVTACREPKGIPHMAELLHRLKAVETALDTKEHRITRLEAELEAAVDLLTNGKQQSLTEPETPTVHVRVEPLTIPEYEYLGPTPEPTRAEPIIRKKRKEMSEENKAKLRANLVRARAMRTIPHEFREAFGKAFNKNPQLTPDVWLRLKRAALKGAAKRWHKEEVRENA